MEEEEEEAFEEGVGVEKPAAADGEEENQAVAAEEGTVVEFDLGEEASEEVVGAMSVEEEVEAAVAF